MLLPKTPKMMNKTSQALEEFFDLACLTIQIVMSETTKTTMKYTNEPAPMNVASKSPKAFANANEETTIPATHKITIIHVKKLAMLYITLEAFSII